MWSTFEDDNFHKSVHLQEFKSELFKNKSEKDLKRNSIELYQYFKPDFIYDKLKSFLDFNLQNKSELNLKSLISSRDNADRKPVSAIVITKNEAENLPSLIRNLNFADELLIVDSFSSDNTSEIMKNYPEVKFIQHNFTNYSNQRNFAIEHAENDWILFIDGDERLPKNLQYEIIKVLESDDDTVAYDIYRQFYFDNKPLKYGGFQSDKVTRFFDKNFARYDETKYVHETLVIEGETKALKGKLLHYSYKDYNSFKQKLASYARLRAQELREKKLKPNFYHFYIKPAYRFIHHYIIRRGFLDGKPGYNMAKLQAYGVKQRFIELKKSYANQL